MGSEVSETPSFIQRSAFNPAFAFITALVLHAHISSHNLLYRFGCNLG
jgi:hypothetical protein